MNNQHSIPINSTANRVIRKGIHYDSGIRRKHLGERPRLLKELQKESLPRNFIDYSGVKYGRCIVIGKCQKKNQEKKRGKTARWLVKCSCGLYMTLDAKHIKKNLQNQDAMCAKCKHEEEIKLKTSLKSYGFLSILPEGFKKYINKKYKDLTVLHLCNTENIHQFINNKPELVPWLVSCDCGHVFKTTITKLEKYVYLGNGLCQECNKKHQKERNDFFIAYGYYPEKHLDLNLLDKGG